MDKTQEALKLALEALKQIDEAMPFPVAKFAQSAIREALAVQPAQQEPFGYFKPEPFGWTDCAETDEGAIALYDRPPASKPWVGLTYDDLDDIAVAAKKGNLYDLRLVIEAKLKEKNT